MSVAEPDRDAIIRREVERSVAPYVGMLPPTMVSKLRELSERYWREHPQAVRALRVLEQRARVCSGTVASGERSGERGDDAGAPTGTGKKV